MSVRYIERAHIGYRTDLPRKGRMVNPATRTEIIHHHTVTIDPDATPNTWENDAEILAKARQMQTIRPDLGLDVPYNALVFCTADGGITLVEGRGWFRSGAHTEDHNTSGLGFGWVGDFFSKPPPAGWPDQVEQLAAWIRDHLRPTWTEIDEVHGHKDFKNTDCPGKVYTQLPLFRSVLFEVPQPPEDDMATLSIIQLQQALVDAGYNIGASGPAGDGVDDDYGPKTKAAFVEGLTAAPSIAGLVTKRFHDGHKHKIPVGETSTPS